MSRVLLLAMGHKLAALDGVAGDFADWILAGLGPLRRPAQVLDVPGGDVLPAPDAAAAVLITGSAANVSESPPWLAASAAWLAECVALGRPVLGICFGHQLLAHALGGSVGFNPAGVEVGSVALQPRPAAAQDPLLGGGAWPAWVNVSHRQSVLRLPAGARVLAASADEAHQAVRYAPLAWGLQFHPEFDARITRAYVDHHAQALLERGGVPAAAHATAQDCPQAQALLGRFAALAGLGPGAVSG